MQGKSDQPERERLLQDLVDLRRSIVGQEREPSPAEEPPDSKDHSEDGLFRLFVDHLPMGVLLVEVERDRYRRPVSYQIRNVNRRYAEYLQIPRVTLLESAFFDVLPGGMEDWNALLETVVMKNRVARGFSLTPSGNKIVHILAFMPRRDTLAIVMDEALTDASVLKGSALDHLRQSEGLLQSLPCMAGKLASDGTLIYANQALRSWLESIDSVESGSPSERSCRIEERTRDWFGETMADLTDEGSAVEIQTSHQKNGETLTVQWYLNGRCDDAGKNREAQVVGVDITASRHQQISLQQEMGLMHDLLEHQAEQRRKHEGTRFERNDDLVKLATENETLKSDVKRLQSLTITGDLIVCNRCSRIHDHSGNWMLPHLYLELHTDAEVKGDVCPYCNRQSARKGSS